MQHRTAARLAVAALAAFPFLAHAQVTMKPDGQWRSLFTAGASIATGNTDAKSASLQGDVVKLTDHDKWSFDGSGQYARSSGTETSNHAGGTALYNKDITPTVFGFGQVDLLHDVLNDLKLRTTLGSGLGYHLLKKPDNTWDVSAGLAYTMDRYQHDQVIYDENRGSYNHADVLLSEESNNKFSDTTTFKQKLTIFPNLRDSDVRASFDTGLSVAMTKRLSLTATYTYRFDSRPGAGLGRTDTLFVTGVSLRFD